MSNHSRIYRVGARARAMVSTMKYQLRRPPRSLPLTNQSSRRQNLDHHQQPPSSASFPHSPPHQTLPFSHGSEIDGRLSVRIPSSPSPFAFQHFVFSISHSFAVDPRFCCVLRLILHVCVVKNRHSFDDAGRDSTTGYRFASRTPRSIRAVAVAPDLTVAQLLGFPSSYDSEIANKYILKYISTHIAFSAHRTNVDH